MTWILVLLMMLDEVLVIAKTTIQVGKGLTAWLFKLNAVMMSGLALTRILNIVLWTLLVKLCVFVILDSRAIIARLFGSLVRLLLLRQVRPRRVLKHLLIALVRIVQLFEGFHKIFWRLKYMYPRSPLLI